LECASSSTNCLSCPSSSFLENNACLSQCSSGYYTTISSNICNNCDNSCLECVSTSTNCVSCPSSSFLENNACLSQCSSGYYTTVSSNICNICDNSCLECASTSTNCILCVSGFSLEGGSCISNSNNGSQSSNSNDNSQTSTSQLCAGNNLGICSNSCGRNQCFDVTKKICLNILNITAVLHQNFTAPNTFSLYFINYTDSLIQRILNNPSNSFQISITNLTSADFSYDFIQVLPGIFKFSFIYHKPIGKSTVLSINFNRTFLSFPDQQLSNASVSITNNDTLTYITAKFEKTKDPLTLPFTFSESFPVLFSMLENVSNISISNFPSSNFSFSIKNTSSNLTFNLLLSYKVSLIGVHSIDLNFDLPHEIFDIQDKQLKTLRLTTSLVNYYILNNGDQTLIKNTQQSISAISVPCTASMNVFALLQSQSSFLFTALLLMNLIQFLKFLNINYPPNALTILEADFRLFNLPTFQINHDDVPVDLKFDYYNVDNYVVNNVGNELLINIFILLSAFTMSFIKQKFDRLFRKWNLAEFMLLFNKLYMILCWNYLCTCVISNLNDYFFFSIINLTFGTYDTIGILNILLGVINISFIIFFLAFLYYKIMIINRLLFLSKVVLKSLAFGTKIFLQKNNSTNVLDRSCIFDQNKVIPIDNLESKNIELNYMDKGKTTLFNENENQFVLFEKLYVTNRQNKVLKKENSINLADCSFSPSRILPQNKICSDTTQRKMVPLEHLDENCADRNSQIELKTNILPETDKKYDENLVSNENFTSPCSSPLKPPTRKKTRDLASLNILSMSTMGKSLANEFIQKEPEKKSEKPKESMEKFEILYGDFKQDSKIQSVYFLLDLMKFPILSLSIILDRYHPLRQSIFISSISFFMILFLLAIRPYKSKYLFITNFLSQLCVLICTASAMVLAYYDDIGSNDQDKRFFVGNIIVFGAMGFIYLISAIVIGFTLISALRFVKLAILFFRKKMKKNMVIPLKS